MCTTGIDGSYNRALWALSRRAPAMTSKIGARFLITLKMLNAKRLHVHEGHRKLSKKIGRGIVFEG
jgi:hypothetical protein